MQENREQGTETFVIEGRNAVLEAFRSGRTIDKIYVLDGCQDGPVRTIVREAKKHGSLINFVTKERLSQLSETGKHQGVIAHAAAYEYSTIDDMLKLAEERGEAPFLILLDNIEDPHNLGAIIRTANLAGAHGVIIPKRRAVSVNSTVNKASAGAVEHMKIARVTNISDAIEELKQAGLWVCGTAVDTNKYYYNQDLTGPLAIVIGNEGKGIGEKVKKNCDFLVKIPMKGKIQSLNASVSTGIVVYEAVKQRIRKEN